MLLTSGIVPKDAPTLPHITPAPQICALVFMLKSPLQSDLCRIDYDSALYLPVFQQAMGFPYLT